MGIPDAPVIAIGGWNSLWPTALRALRKSPSPVAEAGEEVFPEAGTLTLAEARTALQLRGTNAWGATVLPAGLVAR